MVKYLAGFACVLAIVAAPAAARGLDEDADLLRLSHRYAAPLHDCVPLGFSVDTAALDTEAKTARSRLKSAGMKDADIDTLTLLSEEARVDLGDSGGDVLKTYAAASAAFVPAQATCDAMADEPVLQPFVKRVGYQATHGAKSWFGLLQYQADAGDAARMTAIGDIYDAGLEPDPDHSQAFAWYSRAATAGDGRAAAKLSAAYGAGRGVHADLVTADAWARAAQARGDASANPEVIEARLHRTQKSRAEAQARLILSADAVSAPAAPITTETAAPAAQPAAKFHHRSRRHRRRH